MYAQSFGIIGPANFGHDWSKQANFQPVSKHLLAHAKIQSLDIAWLTHWIGISQAKSWKLMQRQNPAMTNRLSTLESSCSGESSIRRTGYEAKKHGRAMHIYKSNPIQCRSVQPRQKSVHILAFSQAHNIRFRFRSFGIVNLRLFFLTFLRSLLVHCALFST